MSTVIILFVVIVVAVLVFIVLSKKQGGSLGANLYKSKALLTANEIEFYTRLTQALPDYLIFPQVSLGALLQPNVKGDNTQVL